jgi:hypothetical protein
VSSFSIDIAAFAKKTNSTLGQAARAIKLSLFRGVIMDTRVDTGRLRGNWQTSTGSPINNTVERFDPSGMAAVNEASSSITELGIDYMTNNLPYAEVWEERDGMIAKNMQRISRNVREVASSVR